MKLFDKYMERVMKLQDRADKFYFEGSRNHADYLPAYEDLKEQFNAVQRYSIVYSGWKKANLLQDYGAASSYEFNKVLETAKKEMKRERQKVLAKVIPNPLQREWYREGYKSGMSYDEWQHDMCMACAYA